MAQALHALPPGSDSKDVRKSVWEGKEGDEQWEADRALLDQAGSGAAGELAFWLVLVCWL